MQAPITRWGLAASAVALLGALASGLASGGAMFSPGALREAGDSAVALGGVAAHAEIGECAGCHAPPWDRGGMAARCLHCHTDVAAELRDTASLHGIFPDPARCLACHTEHAGPAGVLTRFGGRGFDHARLGFSLAAHRRTSAGEPFTCADCHASGGFEAGDESCVACHREVDARFTAAHLLQWGSGCLECHDGSDRFTGFRHDTTGFALEEGHAGVACVECHREVRTPAAFADAPTDCVGCHRADDEHRGSFGADCGSCHAATRWDDVRFEHTFPLDHGEGEASRCVLCHQDAPRSYRTYTCYGCHEHSPESVRREHLEEGIRDYRDCMSCHPTGREDEAERRSRGGEGRSDEDG